MMLAQARLQPAGQRLDSEQRVEIVERKAGQRLVVIEPVDLGHEAIDQDKQTVARVGETGSSACGSRPVPNSLHRASFRRRGRLRRASSSRCDR